MRLALRSRSTAEWIDVGFVPVILLVLVVALLLVGRALFRTVPQATVAPTSVFAVIDTLPVHVKVLAQLNLTTTRPFLTLSFLLVSDTLPAPPVVNVSTPPERELGAAVDPAGGCTPVTSWNLYFVLGFSPVISARTSVLAVTPETDTAVVSLLKPGLSASPYSNSYDNAAPAGTRMPLSVAVVAVTGVAAWVAAETATACAAPAATAATAATHAMMDAARTVVSCICPPLVWYEPCDRGVEPEAETLHAFEVIVRGERMRSHRLPRCRLGQEV